MMIPWWLWPILVFVGMLVWFGYELRRAPLVDDDERPIDPDKLDRLLDDYERERARYYDKHGY